MKLHLATGFEDYWTHRGPRVSQWKQMPRRVAHDGFMAGAIAVVNLMLDSGTEAEFATLLEQLRRETRVHIATVIQAG